MIETQLGNLSGHTHSNIGYVRRFWWLENYDYDIYPEGIYATEAIVPGRLKLTPHLCHFQAWSVCSLAKNKEVICHITFNH